MAPNSKYMDGLTIEIEAVLIECFLVVLYAVQSGSVFWCRIKKVKSAFKWSWRLVVLSIIFVDMLKIQWSRSTNMRPLMISYHSKRLNFVPRVSLLREKERPSEWGWKRLRNSKLTKKTTRIYVALRHQLGIFRVQSLRRVVVPAVS